MFQQPQAIFYAQPAANVVATAPGGFVTVNSVAAGFVTVNSVAATAATTATATPHYPPTNQWSED